MSWSDFGIVVVAITPLVLGVLAFIEKAFERKKKEGGPDKPKSDIVQGMTVSAETGFAKELLDEIKADRNEALEKVKRLKIENDMLRQQLGIKDK